MKLLLILLAFMTVLNCHASAINNDIPKLNVVTEDWPPYNYLDKNGEIVGIATKRVKSILRAADIHYEITLQPWARAYYTAAKEKNTLIYSIIRNEKREPFFHWFCPLSPIESFYFFAFADKPIDIKSLTDLKKYTIAVSRGQFEYNYLKSIGLREAVNLYVTPNDGISFNQLLNKKVDLMVDTINSIENRLRNLGLPSNLLIPVFKLEPEAGIQQCFAISKGTNSEIIKRITEAFEKSLIEKN